MKKKKREDFGAARDVQYKLHIQEW